MIDPVPIAEAAAALKLSPARVRAMAAQGRLSATKLGDRWFVERAAVERRRKEGGHAGRRFSPRNAWALISLASDQAVEGLDPSVRSRLKRALLLEGLEKLSPRLGRRAEVFSFKAHPGEVAHLLKDPRLVRSAISAAGDYELGLVSGQEADGYLRRGQLKKFVADHALEPAGLEGNVHLRLIATEAWEFLEGRQPAPIAAVALDLAEDADPRSAKAGHQALRKLDRHLRRTHGDRASHGRS